MGLIIKNKLPQLIKGYPTVSDKYNVAGGILDNSSASVGFGDLVAYSSITGYYTKAVGTSLPSAGLAGLVVATNVKLLTSWADPTAAVETKPGEAFNLLLDGYIAGLVEITSNTYTNIVPNGQVYYKVGSSAADAIVLADSSVGTAALTGYVFTGVYDVVDATHVLAEIRVK